MEKKHLKTFLQNINSCMKVLCMEAKFKVKIKLKFSAAIQFKKLKKAFNF